MTPHLTPPIPPHPQVKDPETGEYTTQREMSIYFEVDGPYQAMVLPASTEEGKLLKKRYAVYELDGSLAELKGFELKRRGELKLIKVFQEQVFKDGPFLAGDDLESCYAAVATVANRWLDVIDGHGEQLEDEEVRAMRRASDARRRTRTHHTPAPPHTLLTPLSSLPRCSSSCRSRKV